MIRFLRYTLLLGIKLLMFGVAGLLLLDLLAGSGGRSVRSNVAGFFFGPLGKIAASGLLLIAVVWGLDFGKMAAWIVILLIGKAGMGVGGDSLGGIMSAAQLPAAKQEMAGLGRVLTAHYVQNGSYPATQSELGTVISEHYDRPLIQVGRDPWGSPYVFLTPEFLVISAGPDRKLNRTDDLQEPYPGGATRPADGALRLY